MHGICPTRTCVAGSTTACPNRVGRNVIAQGAWRPLRRLTMRVRDDTRRQRTALERSPEGFANTGRRLAGPLENRWPSADKSPISSDQFARQIGRPACPRGRSIHRTK